MEAKGRKKKRKRQKKKEGRIENPKQPVRCGEHAWLCVCELPLESTEVSCFQNGAVLSSRSTPGNSGTAELLLADGHL